MDELAEGQETAGAEPQAEFDAEGLMAEIDKPSPERPMSAPPQQAGGGQAPTQPPAAAAQPPAKPQEWEFKWNGKSIKAPQDMVLTKYAPMGYDYAQKMEAFKRDQEAFKQQQQGYEKYKKIDEYVQKDPAWWKHVEEQYQNRLASEDPMVQRVNLLMEEKLKPVNDLLKQREEAEKQQKISQEDTTLQKDIESIRKKYSDLDFDAQDAEGKSLEYRILEHGTAHGHPSFRAAFHDFYSEQLEKIWEARGREAMTKESQKKAKLGLSAPTPQAPKKATDDYEVKGKSYDQLFKEIVEREAI